ncbi:MAG: hypothetical protein AAFX04_01185 [Pseudomonadota bacterium]
MVRERVTRAVGEMRAIGNPGKMTHREYQAALNALNIFFGAIIGVSLGNIETIPTWDYVILLVVTSALVMQILLVSYTHRRIWNMLMLVIFLGAAWYIHLNPRSDIELEFPSKLLPTLSVWAVLAFGIEFSERTDEPE